MQSPSPQKVDLQLLQNKPQELLKKYYPLMVKAVQAHVEASAFTTLSAAEMLQIVRKKIYQQLLKLYKRFGKRSYIKTLILEATRMLCHHAEDLYLLEHESPQLVVKYKPTIANQTYIYVNSEKVRDDQAEDVMQYVSVQLLSKLQSDKINFQSKGALFRTYFHQIIDNAIKDGIRRLHSKKALMGSGSELKAHHAIDENAFGAVSNKINLEKQCKLYRELLKQFKPMDCNKFELSAKVSCYLVLENNDVKLVMVSDDMRIEILVCFGKNYTSMNKEELWNTLVQFTNVIEGKKVSANSLYKWFARRRNLLIARILYVLNFDGKLQKTLSDIEQNLLAKLSQRSVSKFTEDYFGDLVYASYR